MTVSGKPVLANPGNYAGMNLLDQIAEARIQEAIEQGELRDLPGAGKPLRLDDRRGGLA